MTVDVTETEVFGLVISAETGAPRDTGEIGFSNGCATSAVAGSEI